MNRRTITVFEYETLRSSASPEDGLGPSELEALQRHSGEDGVPYYSLIHKGVKFCEYVGVIQVGNLTIEVLPKIDRGGKDKWKKILVDMLKKVGHLDVAASSETSLKIKRNSILDLYLESFLDHVQLILHRGLLKKYRKVEANSIALKGKLIFQKHIAANTVHKERFFVKYTIFDSEHLLNQLLYKTLLLIRTVNANQALTSMVNALLLNFPEMADLRVSEAIFDKIVYSRKNEHYRKAMMISRLLLLNYFPDINGGKNQVVAIMFDMNLLWERFVYQSLKKYIFDGQVQAQSSKPYWKLSGRRPVGLKPDVVILKDGVKYVLDTKWKLPGGNRPSHGDLQQMYAYTKYFGSDHTILCYPGSDDDFIDGYFHNEDVSVDQHYRCSVIRLKFDMDRYSNQNFISNWQMEIADRINNYCQRRLIEPLV